MASDGDESPAKKGRVEMTLTGTEKQIKYASACVDMFTDRAKEEIADLEDVISDYGEYVAAGKHEDELGNNVENEIAWANEMIRGWNIMIDAVHNMESASAVIENTKRIPECMRKISGYVRSGLSFEAACEKPFCKQII